MRKWLPGLPEAGTITAIDTLGDRSVTFKTTLNVTGDATLDLPESAYRRLVSYFLISKLSGEALKEACEALVENFVWNLKTPGAAELPDEVFDLVGGITFVDGEQVSLAD